jgi:hypothetical protein
LSVSVRFKKLFFYIRHRIGTLFAWLISHQPAVLFSQNKPATSNQPAILFSQNKPAPAISHQPTEQAVYISVFPDAEANFVTNKIKKHGHPTSSRDRGGAVSACGSLALADPQGMHRFRQLQVYVYVFRGKKTNIHIKLSKPNQAATTF